MDTKNTTPSAPIAPVVSDELIEQAQAAAARQASEFAPGERAALIRQDQGPVEKGRCGPGCPRLYFAGTAAAPTASASAADDGLCQEKRGFHEGQGQCLSKKAVQCNGRGVFILPRPFFCAHLECCQEDSGWQCRKGHGGGGGYKKLHIKFKSANKKLPEMLFSGIT